MIGEKVRALRQSLDLTQKEFAEKIAGKGDYTYIGKIERGDQWPSLKFLAEIGKTYGKPLSYFFEDAELPDTRAADLRRTKVKSLGCLLSRFNWQVADFRACRRVCKQMPLCRVIKVLVNRNGQSEKG